MTRFENQLVLWVMKALALITIAFYFYLCLLSTGCKKKGEVPTATRSPTGMVISTPLLDRTALFATQVVYKVVPPEFQDRESLVRFKSVDNQMLCSLRMRDLISPLSSPPKNLIGYTQFPLNNPDEIGGVYTNIYLLSAMPKQETAHTAVHEWGHYVYWMLSNSGEKAEWDFVFSALLPEDLPERYRSQGPNENFAEFFALWCAKKMGAKNKIPASVNAYFNQLQEVRRG